MKFAAFGPGAGVLPWWLKALPRQHLMWELLDQGCGSGSHAYCPSICDTTHSRHCRRDENIRPVYQIHKFHEIEVFTVSWVLETWLPAQMPVKYLQQIQPIKFDPLPMLCHGFHIVPRRYHHLHPAVRGSTLPNRLALLLFIAKLGLHTPANKSSHSSSS